ASWKLGPRAQGSAPLRQSGVNRSRRRHVVAIVLIASAAWYFAGPPWHLDRHHRSIDWHEQVHLGGLQAIHSGYAPYIGPASNQYGPGFQFITYSLMTRLFQFDIVGFRESFA